MIYALCEFGVLVHGEFVFTQVQVCEKALDNSSAELIHHNHHPVRLEDQQLVFYEQRFSNHGPSATRSEQPSNTYNNVYENHGEIPYH